MLRYKIQEEDYDGSSTQARQFGFKFDKRALTALLCTLYSPHARHGSPMPLSAFSQCFQFLNRDWARPATSAPDWAHTCSSHICTGTRSMCRWIQEIIQGDEIRSASQRLDLALRVADSFNPANIVHPPHCRIPCV